MENHLNERVEKDAVQIPFRNSEIGNSSRNSEVIEFNRSSSQTVNNNLMLNQTNSSTILTFNDCKELTFGSVINIVSQNTQKQVSKSRRTNDESAYSKTPTIKEMLESSDPISSALLHSFCESFGTEWRKVTVVLKINQLFVDRMHEDYFIQFGTKEVLMFHCSLFFMVCR